MNLTAIIEWDVLNWSKALVFWQPVIDELPRTARILALGDYNGGLSLWLAQQGFSVICSDAPAPSSKAITLHARNKVMGKMYYLGVDAFAMPFPDGYFDLVICKSVIGGLARNRNDTTTRTFSNQYQAVEEIRRVLKSDGWFLGAENKQGCWLHQVMRWIRHRGDVRWRYFAPWDATLLCLWFETFLEQSYGFLGTHWPLALINRLTAKLDAALLHWLPAEWLYITFFSARK